MATSWGGSALAFGRVMSFLILSYSFPLGLMPGTPVAIASLGLIVAYLVFFVSREPRAAGLTRRLRSRRVERDPRSLHEAHDAVGGHDFRALRR